ncbi:MAG: Crp/Fnr family transcriptional regulator [Holophagales bacterium]|nr:Crp/Fnr family transcriptional regulator [Holophagales bacterium]
MTHALLERIVLFRCLNPAEARALAEVCRLQVCERGDTVFVEGTRAKEMSFVALGTVKIVKATPARNVILRIVGAGSPVGIVAAWEGRPYPGTAIAVEPSTIVHVPEREFFSLTDRHPEILRQLLKLMMDRQVQLGQRVSEMTGSVETRVAQALLDLVVSSGKAEAQGASISLALTRQEIADLAGTTVETAIRIMSRWGKEGLVLTEGDGFVIPDVERLRAHLG